ncbi:GPI transamidase component PIG-S [Condylostylus longicornis]|uniref:GPI transamidase component PIG-S n=1 Tax=Condylostylus longicornis TaxID=2530218 RepID=UPI00244DCACC|nr:GPI transamidase component PIG-S [Condylostylus longicornis]
MEDSSKFKNEKIKDKFQIYSSLAFMVVVVIIGVPMWWKTTEVYRSTLPNNEIKYLNAKNIKIFLNVYVCSSDILRSTYLIEGIKSYFEHSDIFHINFVPLNVSTNDIKTPASLENLLKTRFVKINIGDFLIMEWISQKEDVLVTSERTAYISKEASPKQLAKVLRHVLKVNDILNIINEKKSDRIHGSYVLNHQNVVISVINPNPNKIDVKWNVKEAVQLYLEPLLKYINPISKFTLKTQFKYQISLDLPLKHVKDESKTGRHYGLSEADLPHIITSVEKNLGFITSDNPVINLVIYISPCETSPIYIYQRHESINLSVKNSSVQSFISPKWGSVAIYNPPLAVCEKYEENSQRTKFNVNSKDVMQSLLFQLQNYYEINLNPHIEGVKIIETQSLYPHEWQYDGYIRRIVVSEILTAIRTLQSLIQLLNNINYIVINDDVGVSINKAYENVIKAKEFLINGNLTKAAKYAHESYVFSERAFFDASLLAQLYFPDEQKYAIYIPLFLPIMVPVVTSSVMIFKWYTKGS